jgi:DNA-binding response OmpR family regulator
VAADGAAARRALDADGPDAVVLDLGLPDERGFDLLRDLRRASDVPILVLTALGEEADRVAGLELGADDYLVKPFSLRELTARIAALLRRRAPAAPPDVLRFGPLQIDLTAREVRETGGPIGLARLEYDLLVYLASTPRRTFTYDQILEAIWGLDAALQDRATVNEHVHRLRRKLPLHGDGPRISTVRGVGYRFDP